MCGIAGIFGNSVARDDLEAMVASQHHRGPDASGIYIDPAQTAGLGHNRLSIIDLSDAGSQPMSSADGRYKIAFNGEIYNYVELRAELSDYPYRSQSDTEVILAAYQRWGESCLDHFIGMFSLMIWDETQQRLFAARDRFGVKPLYYAKSASGQWLLASEIRALRAAGLVTQPDTVAWATYLAAGVYEHSARTFWRDVASLPAGHQLTIQNNQLNISCWYDLVQRSGQTLDTRSEDEVAEEYLAVLKESTRLRFRSDVPVGVNLSGGLDSSALLGLVQELQGESSEVKAFTFVTGDDRYDELPWVHQMLAHTKHPSIQCTLRPSDVPELAESVQSHQDEPFGGMPTLAYAQLFARARAEGVIVLLDGQGLDEQWAGYDYYKRVLDGTAKIQDVGTVQAAKKGATRPNCLSEEFAAVAESFQAPTRYPDALRNLQYRDAMHTKIPRALRFNDRISMRSSTELREPFLDHRLFELALRQPADRKIANGVQKRLLRKIVARLMPGGVVEAPKRPLQTPQREWLREDLRDWADANINSALETYGGQWLDARSVRNEWDEYQKGESDNSFYVWQWINLGLCCNSMKQLVAS
ncbi:asparagine synthase (glutamine-hydrolyzing) [Novipirellula sp.]|uniref:asparagine synthase (glutamine-hydrolyzing) n=1 Tax=Novipirellula sp. TaxID=2795430 RepID=UPI0035654246